VRRACKALGGIVSVAPFIGSDAMGRIYHQLNADYEPLHALCRFFLDHLGPAHERGDRPMLPFLVDMARLFEEFVAAWLSSHLPPYLAALPQEKVSLGADRRVRFEIDIVIRHLSSGRNLAVLDTKYKNQRFPQSADVQQAIAYAEARNCHHAFLVYPQELESPFRGELKNHTVETLAFPLDGDLDAAGERFLEQLLTRLEPKVAALEAGA
jgi:5-methylcytosine-specific restriction enzyme subunit McrC